MGDLQYTKCILKAATDRRKKQKVISLLPIATFASFFIYLHCWPSISLKNLADSFPKNVPDIFESNSYITWQGLEEEDGIDLLFTRFQQGDTIMDEERRKSVLNPSQKHALSPLGRTPMGDRVLLLWIH